MESKKHNKEKRFKSDERKEMKRKSKKNKVEQEVKHEMKKKMSIILQLEKRSKTENSTINYTHIIGTVTNLVFVIEIFI